MCKYCRSIQKEHFSLPKEGDLKVWWIPQIPDDQPFEYPVKNIQEAKKILDILAEYDLYQCEHNIKPDYSNVGGLQVFEDGEWIEWMNMDGYDIDEVDENGNLVED
jgi:hypothetical protein